MTALFFLVFAALAVFCAINLVVQTHPIASALSLIPAMWGPVPTAERLPRTI